MHAMVALACRTREILLATAAMIAWYYSKDGQQNGPVSQEELARLIGTGSVGAKDLVWREGITDWTPAGAVPEFASSPPPVPASVPVATAPAGPLNPYQAPESSWMEQVSQIGDPVLGQEIIPGSQPLDIVECIKRAFELTKRHFGILIGAGVVYWVVLFVFQLATGFAARPFGQPYMTPDGMMVTPPMATVAGTVVWILNQILGIFLGLGLARVGLNVVSGKEATVGMLFGEGRKMMTAVGATILYVLMVAVGFVLLIVPGIYLALRFGQFQNAIVDKDLGVIDSLKYSARLTEGNKMNLFGLYILLVLIAIAGAIALLVGLIFTIPMFYMGVFLAYRWLQYGRAALSD